ncbi:MAG: hypothetical protein LKF75_02255 [Bacilli bacterium]|jgi:hypothetical protein|nr:hypothetical protein [Bacilli bacterium]MCH4210978.1 hypothetical protein [Bacilli bacterium]MCH4228511.1 hypothetical protein [Bacilli bacterium]MCH4277793.1 hypothetical protein [Bacilli bacterium]MCI2054963.1 hypothetical protein [Bacilli bacterium]
MEDKKEVVSDQDGNGNETAKKAEEEKKDKEESPKAEEKKEGGFKKWWNSTKKSVDDSILEGKIKSAYVDAHTLFDVYSYDGGLFDGSSVYGEIKDGALTYFGDLEIKPYSVIISSKDQKAYYALESEKVQVESAVEGTTYSRPGFKVTLDEKVEEVPVIKAGKRYFLYKGKKD